MTNDPIDRGHGVQNSVDEAEEPPFKVLTREEAQAFLAKHPPFSPWRAIVVQAAVGVVCAALAWAITQRGEAAWSALYGAAAVVIPGSLMARGMTRRPSVNSGAAMAGFMFWEFVKIVTAVAMLAAAVKVVPDLSWPALLVTMIVCLKVNWLMLLRRHSPVVTETQQKRV
jgi:ATP synthase protein I